MDTIVFQALNQVGGLISEITLIGNVVYGTDFYDEAINQSKLDTVDGGTIVYDNTSLNAIAVLLIKGVDYTDGMNFRAWVRNDLIFQANFVAIGSFAEIDIGKGVDTSILYADRAKYLYPHTKKLTKLSAPGVHTVRFDYKFRR